MIQDSNFYLKISKTYSHLDIFYFDSLYGFDYHCLNCTPNSIFQFNDNRLIKRYNLFEIRKDLKFLFNLPDLDEK
jgi:hypothetical protein